MHTETSGSMGQARRAPRVNIPDDTKEISSLDIHEIAQEDLERIDTLGEQALRGINLQEAKTTPSSMIMDRAKQKVHFSERLARISGSISQAVAKARDGILSVMGRGKEDREADEHEFLKMRTDRVVVESSLPLESEKELRARVAQNIRTLRQAKGAAARGTRKMMQVVQAELSYRENLRTEALPADPSSQALVLVAKQISEADLKQRIQETRREFQKHDLAKTKKLDLQFRLHVMSQEMWRRRDYRREAVAPEESMADQAELQATHMSLPELQENIFKTDRKIQSLEREFQKNLSPDDRERAQENLQYYRWIFSMFSAHRNFRLDIHREAKLFPREAWHMPKERLQALTTPALDGAMDAFRIRYHFALETQGEARAQYIRSVTVALDRLFEEYDIRKKMARSAESSGISKPEPSPEMFASIDDYPKELESLRVQLLGTRSRFEHATQKKEKDKAAVEHESYLDQIELVENLREAELLEESLRVTQKLMSALGTETADEDILALYHIQEEESRSLAEGRNQAYVVKTRTVPEGGKAVRGFYAVVKRSASEVPHIREGIEFGTYFKREWLAYIIDLALGIGVVPPTMLTEVRHQGSDGREYSEVASAQMFVEGKPALSCPKDWESRVKTSSLVKIAILDVILQHSDRHLNNFLIDDAGECIAIDNGISLPEVPAYGVIHSLPAEKFYNLNLVHDAKKTLEKLEAFPGSKQAEAVQEAFTVVYGDRGKQLFGDMMKRIDFIAKNQHLPTSNEGALWRFFLNNEKKTVKN